MKTLPFPLFTFPFSLFPFLFSLFTFLFSLFPFPFSPLSAQPPSWHDYTERHNRFPASRYFTGFGQIKVEKNENPEEKLKRAKSDAGSEATQTIETTIQTVTYHQVGEMDKRIAEEFRQSVSTFSDVTIQGLRVETFYDKKTRTAEAFAWVKKEDLAGTCFKLFKVQKTQLDAKIKEAKGYQSGGQGTRALETWQDCLPMVRELQKNMVMVIICGGEVDGKMPLEYQSEINTAITAMEQSPVTTAEELCQRLANTLQKQLDQNTLLIRLAPFTFQDTKMASQLSAKLLPVMEQKLTDKGIAVAALATGKSFDNALLLTGVYWEEVNGLSFTVTVHDPASGKAFASAVNTLPLWWLKQNGISWKPENLEEALIRQKVMTKDEITGGGLLLEVWTNKGNENLLFSEGETMKLSVRANHECYLRFIYYFADSTKTLLDEFYISSDQVNKIVTLPVDYACLSPFGVELLQVAAQNEPFKPLKWRMENGYKFILEDTHDIVSNTRGFQKKTDQQLFTEKRLIITTLPVIK
jgi:hypothetical protein